MACSRRGLGEEGVEGAHVITTNTQNGNVPLDEVGAEKGEKGEDWDKNQPVADIDSGCDDDALDYEDNQADLINHHLLEEGGDWHSDIGS